MAPKKAPPCEDGDNGSLFGSGGVESSFEVWRGDDAGDHTEVIAVEDGADGGEDGDQELGCVVSDVSSSLGSGKEMLTW
jgi:hypothetical protein